MSREESSILEVAREAAVAASRVCRAVQESLGDVSALYKDAREPVTVADYGSQAVILEAVARCFPEHGVVSEEGAEHLRADGDTNLRDLVTRLVGRSFEFSQDRS